MSLKEFGAAWLWWGEASVIEVHTNGRIAWVLVDKGIGLENSDLPRMWWIRMSRNKDEQKWTSLKSITLGKSAQWRSVLQTSQQNDSYLTQWPHEEYQHGAFLHTLEDLLIGFVKSLATPLASEVKEPSWREYDWNMYNIVFQKSVVNGSASGLGPTSHCLCSLNTPTPLS